MSYGEWELFGEELASVVLIPSSATPGFLLLENNVDEFLLEDNSGVLQLES